MEPDWRLGECVPQHLLQQHAGEVCVGRGREVDAIWLTFPEASSMETPRSLFHQQCSLVISLLGLHASFGEDN